MKERLLGYIFCAIFLAFAVNLAVDAVHTRYFSASLWFQTHWILPFVIVPAALLLGLAWAMGFYRKGGARWADLLATAAAALILYLTLGAGYSCWHYCF